VSARRRSQTDRNPVREGRDSDSLCVPVISFSGKAPSGLIARASRKVPCMSDERRRGHPGIISRPINRRSSQPGLNSTSELDSSIELSRSDERWGYPDQSCIVHRICIVPLAARARKLGVLQCAVPAPRNISVKRLKFRLSGSARKSQKRFRDTPRFKFPAVLARIQPFQRSNERSERGDHPV
jgi:hypothetical protein